VFRRARHKKQGPESEVNAIEKAHAREEGMELLSDLGDVVLKSLLEDVPVVGMVAKALRGAQSVVVRRAGSRGGALASDAVGRRGA
jgi:hypothetical protein